MRLRLWIIALVVLVIAPTTSSDAREAASDTVRGSAFACISRAAAHRTRGEPVGLSLRDGSEIEGSFVSVDWAARSLCVVPRESTAARCLEVSEIDEFKYWERGHLSKGWMFGGFAIGAVVGTTVGAVISNRNRDPSELSDFRGLGTYYGLLLGSAVGLTLGTVIPPTLPCEQTVSCE